MPVNSSDAARPLSTFTVEQLMLIQKLKESGISKEQVAYVFDSYDRLDRELGSLYNIPIALALQAQTLQRIALHGRVPDLSSFTSSSTAADHLHLQVPTSASCASGSQVHAGTMGANSFDHTRANDGSTNSLGNDFPVVEPDFQDFISFLGKGDAACCEDIRQFVVRHGIKQQQIAILSGICQSYVSRFLKGDLYEMSERSRHAICKWYLKYRSNPALIDTYREVGVRAAVCCLQGPAANLASIFNNASNESTFQQLSQKRFFDPASLDLGAMAANPSISELLGCQRRERFVFRSCQIEILERYFQESSYPTTDVRAEIAAACNAALEKSVGRKLSDRETVTVQIVSNWFANKRKDLKKAAKEGGHDVSELLLRSRGRPPQLFYYSGGPMERDSNDYDNANFASDDSASEVDQYNETPSDQSLSQERTGNDNTPIVKVEAPYEDNYGVIDFGNTISRNFESASTFQPRSGYGDELNGTKRKSSSIVAPAAGPSMASDACFTASAAAAAASSGV